jgi:hypothetical protein
MSKGPSLAVFFIHLTGQLSCSQTRQPVLAFERVLSFLGGCRQRFWLWCLLRLLSRPSGSTTPLHHQNHRQKSFLATYETILRSATAHLHDLMHLSPGSVVLTSVVRARPLIRLATRQETIALWCTILGFQPV